MPMKWTPDNDQLLLLKILETHSQFSVDTNLVASAWPEEREKPTPRAIAERLVKLRKTGNSSFSVGKGTATSTPKKSGKASLPTPPPTTHQETKKRKRTGEDERGVELQGLKDAEVIDLAGTDTYFSSGDPIKKQEEKRMKREAQSIDLDSTDFEECLEQPDYYGSSPLPANTTWGAPVGGGDSGYMSALGGLEDDYRESSAGLNPWAEGI